MNRAMISRRALLMSTTGMSMGACLPLTVWSASPAAMDTAHPKETPMPKPVKKTKIFHSVEGFGPITNLGGLTDSTVVKRGNQWWLYLAGFDQKRRILNLWSASLPAGKPLDSSGWSITTVPNDPQSAIELVAPSEPGSWNGSGGRHCPSYVHGWDPALNGGAGGWQERIYYAGSAGGFAGPYSIGFLAWNGERWVEHEGGPVFPAAEPWESNSVYEPNLIYHKRKWCMWYCAGPDASNDVVHGYAESSDGRTNWNRHIFWPATDNVFDQAILAGNGRFEAVLAGRSLSGKPTPHLGLWWTHARAPSADRAAWSQPVQLLNPFDGTPWHDIGVWKPSIQYSDTDPKRLFVFFDGAGKISAEAAGSNPGRPFELALGCLECVLE